MHNMFGKVFLSCALGALVGSLVALELNVYLWWIGLAAGALVGYLAYEFKKVIKSIPLAWSAIVSLRQRMELKERFQRSSWVLYSGFIFLITFWIGAFLIILIMFVLMSLFSFEQFSETFILSIIGASLLGCVFAIGCIVVAIIFFFDELVPEYKEIIKGEIKLLNPFSVYFHYLPIGIRFCFKNIRLYAVRIPSITKQCAIRTIDTALLVIVTLGQFVRQLFILIHSEIRLLCAFDAALGTAIGYFFGSALIGSLAGGIIGLLDYHFISIRALHLVPKLSKS